ncbi:MFS transporter [Oceanobacillus piezotolerans]|uniref:MFS transporter n=1 Tax=Oceanobacillus piezotolerans TaxID=2448030 RepID=A0A498DEW3_9BACI|nr:MFS transporter [Oceanobacillus piezotolerans]RLL47748.1 MFS transporter [Oceanobacillus piezotolerans]
MEEQFILKRATYHLWTFAISKFISNFGAQVYAFTVSFYILQLTGSATNFAVNLLCNVVPRIIVSPFAGYMADRFDRKKIVILSHMITALSIIALICMVLVFGLSLSILYSATAIFSITSTFSGLAFTSSITGLIDQHRIQKATAINQMVISIAAIASPAIGGILYGFVILPVLLLMYLTAVIIALILESTMNFTLFSTANSEANASPQESLWKNMIEGWNYVKGRPLIMAIISIALIVNFLVGAFQVGYSYVMIENLNMPAEKFGIVESFFAIGMLLMAAYLSFRKEFRFPLIVAKRGILSLGIIIGIFTIPLLINMNSFVIFTYYALLMFLSGSTIIIINTPVQVMMQKLIHDSYKGRVFSIVETGAQALIPLGTIAFGILYDILPAHWIMVSSGCLLIIAVLYLARPAVIRKAHPEWQIKHSA